LIGMDPQGFAGPFVEAVHALDMLGLALTIEDVNAPAGNDGAGVPRSDRSAPAHFQSGGWDGCKHALFVPDSIPARATPLRPILPVQYHAADKQQDADNEPSRAHRKTSCQYHDRRHLISSCMIPQPHHYDRKGPQTGIVWAPSDAEASPSELQFTHLH